MRSFHFRKPKVDSTLVPSFLENETYLSFDADSSLSFENYLTKESRKIWYPIFFGTYQEIEDLCSEYSYFSIIKDFVINIFRKSFEFFKIIL